MFAAALVLGLVALACADDGSTSDPTTGPSIPSPAAAGPQTITVNVDGGVEGRHASLFGYFPGEVSVRPGDTVEFEFLPSDPHTVSLGTVVDEGLAAFAAADPAGPPPPEAAKIPFVLGDTGTEVIYSALLPCFTEADPPTDGSPCPEAEQPAFDGTAAFYNSGLREPGGDAFTVDIAEDAAPGTYNYFCLLHGPDMGGTLTVVGPDDDVPTADEVAAQAAAESQAVVEAAMPALEALSEGKAAGLEGVVPEGPDQVVAGGFLPGPVPVDLLEFGPTDVSIPAGESVTFNVVGFHTVSFNPTQDATPPFILGEEGLPVINQLAFAPQGGAAGAPPPPEGPSGPPPTGPPPPPMVIDGGSWDGAGFFSSGVLPSFPPALFAYEVTFETAGTYNYVCLIHPGMEGTVTVT